MTDTSGTTSASAGWYPVGDGSHQLRWWDGTQWTEHTHDAAGASQTPYSLAAAFPIVSADKPVYNPFIWLITLLPLLSIVVLATFDMNAYMQEVMSDPTGPGAVLYGPDLLLTGLGFVSYFASVLLAYFDGKKLATDGFVRPFHWAWTFLGAVVYIIGRSVVVFRRSGGRGLWPIWVHAAIILLSVVVSAVKVADAVSQLTPALTSNA